MDQYWLDLADLRPEEKAATAELPGDRTQILSASTLAVLCQEIPVAAWSNLGGIIVRWGDQLLGVVLALIKSKSDEAGLNPDDIELFIDRQVIRVIQPDGTILHCRRVEGIDGALVGKGDEVHLTGFWEMSPFRASELRHKQTLVIAGRGFTLLVTQVTMP